MNLENLNVSELDAQEKVNVDGGADPVTTVVVGVVIGSAIEIINDFDHFVDGLFGN